MGSGPKMGLFPHKKKSRITLKLMQKMRNALRLFLYMVQLMLLMLTSLALHIIMIFELITGNLHFFKHHF